MMANPLKLVNCWMEAMLFVLHQMLVPWTEDSAATLAQRRRGWGFRAMYALTANGV